MRHLLFLTLLLLTVSVLPAYSQATADEFLAHGNERRKADPEGAIADYTKAIELNPSLAKAYINRGALRGAKTDYDGAIADSTKAIELDPSIYQAYFGRAAAYAWKGNNDEAIADAAKAIEIDPALPDAYRIRGLALLRKHDYKAALPDWNRCIELGMTDPPTYYNRAVTLEGLSDFAAAIVDETKALELDPKYVRGYAMRALSRRSYLDYEGAIADYNKVLEFDPADKTSVLGRSWARLFMNDGAGAYQDAVKFIAMNGSPAGEGSYAVAIAYIGLHKSGKPAAATKYLEASIKQLKPDEWPTRLLRFLAGQLTDEQLLSYAPDAFLQTDAHSFIGIKRVLENKPKEAATQFQWCKDHGNRDRIAYQLARVEFARL